jgi:transcription termination/antitermination protein NusG
MSDILKTYWTAFYTKPRNEKKASERLMSDGYEIYCPTRSVIKQWSDRKKKVTEPVFSSYIFANVNEISRTEILMDSSIVSNVHWLGKPVVIRDQEILEIRNFLNEFPSANIVSNDFQNEDKVLVNSGPLSKFEGTVSKIIGNKAVLNIESLGIVIHAEVSLNRLEKI